LRKKTNIPKSSWYFTGGSFLLWGFLFLGVVVPLFYRLPHANTLDDVSKGVFIAERAQSNLYDFDKIGTKLVGSDANENKTVQFLLSELALIQANVLEDFFDMEIDRQIVSGSYVKAGALFQYQAVQNIVIKVTPKNCTSEDYLLVNTHFDSKPATPSAGDAGHMVVSVLEVLRVITATREKFKHTIIFLLNGAEENSLQASHGFITQHKWASNCKLVVQDCLIYQLTSYTNIFFKES